jgi:uncharacterized protein (TIGR02271 family)
MESIMSRYPQRRIVKKRKTMKKERPYMKATLVLTGTLLLVAGCQSSKVKNQSTYTPPAYTPAETPAPATGGLEVADQADINLHKEELVVGKREVSNGGVMVRTVVKSEEVKQPVQLRREEYVVERIPAGSAKDQEARSEGAAFNSREIYIPLMKEEPITGKRTLLTESITLGKRVEKDKQTVSMPIRTEDVKIVKNPDLSDAKFSSVPRRSTGNAVLISGAGAPPLAETGGSISIAKEELLVGKQEKDAGGVYLQKIIHTENASQPVELRREEYTVSRQPLSGEVSAIDFTPRQIQLALGREEAVAGTRNFVTETVRVRKQIQTDQQVVSGTVRQESAEIIRMPESAVSAQGSPAGAQSGTQSSGSMELTRDEALVNHVKTTLAKPDGSSSGYQNIAVTSNGGEVTLRGDVSSKSEKKQIGKRVEKMSGVRSVDNELRVWKP